MVRYTDVVNQIQLKLKKKKKTISIQLSFDGIKVFKKALSAKWEQKINRR